ncbi:hypothetical protein BH11ACT4_BH11ACT4_07600 [soil metagenome]
MSTPETTTNKPGPDVTEEPDGTPKENPSGEADTASGGAPEQPDK